MPKPNPSTLNAIRNAETNRQAGETAIQQLASNKPVLIAWLAETAATRQDIIDAADIARASSDVDLLQAALRFIHRSLQAGV